MENLGEALEELIQEYGEAAVFQEINPEGDVKVIDVFLWNGYSKARYSQFNE